jgi:hypothetical protein
MKALAGRGDFDHTRAGEFCAQRLVRPRPMQDPASSYTLDART